MSMSVLTKIDVQIGVSVCVVTVNHSHAEIFPTTSSESLSRAQ